MSLPIFSTEFSLFEIGNTNTFIIAFIESAGKRKNNQNQDPYARPNQKKQGRELKNKARSRFVTQIKYRRGRRPPKKHTPKPDHRRFIYILLSYLIEDFWEDENE